MTLIRAIIVEDSEDDLLLVLRALKRGGFDVLYTRVETEEGLKEALEDERWQLVISDHAMPLFSADEALFVLARSGRDLPFIIVSGTIGEEIAVKAMKSGAHDYIMKDSLSRLAPAVERELREAALREENLRNRERLAYMTLHDPLTGLYNRLYFENELERLAGGRDHPLALISADIDGLKLINETLGQKEGDRYLQLFAKLLKKSLRKSDLLARTGGDEFAAILPQTEAKTALDLAEQVRQAVANYNRESKQLPLAVSLGCAFSKKQSENPVDILKRADQLLHLDKQNHSGSSRNQVVRALLAALAERDYIAGGHAARLQKYCREMGLKVGLDRLRLAALELTAQVHDLGKIGIPDQILFKNCGLSEGEWEIMRQHPEKGYRIACASPELAGIAELILRHHERYDGTGYPLGLSGEEIPLECRILSIADAFDAMTSERPYRVARTTGEALAELKKCSGTQFDPLLVKIFSEIVAANNKK